MHTENTNIGLKALFGRICCKEPQQDIWLEDWSLYISIYIFVLAEVLPNAASKTLDW